MQQIRMKSSTGFVRNIRAKYMKWIRERTLIRQWRQKAHEVREERLKKEALERKLARAETRAQNQAAIAARRRARNKAARAAAAAQTPTPSS
jgi:hypothetical protein